MLRNKFISEITLLALLATTNIVAQKMPEDEFITIDAYQDAFYEALKHKSIENYDKAIIELQKCIKLKPIDAVAYHELGKNFLALNDYDNALAAFTKATDLDPKNKWYWLGIYDLSFETKNYPLAIRTIQKIIPFDEEYKDDLISLYMITDQKDKALLLIDEMNAKFGKSEDRNRYKKEIEALNNNQGDEVSTLINLINKHPKVETNYVKLIVHYGERNENAKAAEVLKMLQKEIPDNSYSGLQGFTIALKNNQLGQALELMQNLKMSEVIASNLKIKLETDFLSYIVSYPEAITMLEKLSVDQLTSIGSEFTRNISLYFLDHRNYKKAIELFEFYLQNENTDDIEVNLGLLQAYSQLSDFNSVLRHSMSLVESFPSQPEFYLYAGIANNRLKQYKNAKTILEIGMDYIVDNLSLEEQLHRQLSEAYGGLGDERKKDEYFLKASTLLKRINNKN